MPRRSLSRRFIRRAKWVVLVVLVAAGVAGICWAAVYRLRQSPHAGTFLVQAGDAEKDGRFAEAASALENYLKLNPKDTRARTRYCLLLEKLASTPEGKHRFAAACDELLAQEPERHDIRQRLVVTRLQLGEINEADKQLKVLVAALPDESEVQDLLGQCKEARQDFPAAVQAYRAAIRLNSLQADSYERLARLLRQRMAKPADADKVVDEMIQANPKAWRAWLARAFYRKQVTGSLTSAASDVAEALKLGPDESAVLYTAAELARVQGKPDEARTYLERGTARYPAESRFLQALAEVDLAAGKSQEAVAHLRKALQIKPDDPVLLWTLADLSIDVNDFKQARDMIERLRAVKLLPGRVEFLDARLALVEKRFADAALLAERSRPQLADAKELAFRVELILGESLRELGDMENAASAFRRATRLEPGNLRAKDAVIMAELRMGKLDEAIADQQALLNLTGAPPAGWIRLGQMLTSRNLSLPAAKRDWKPVEAVVAKAVATNPQSNDLLLLQTDVLSATGQIEQAMLLVEQGQKKEPANVALIIARARLAARRDGKPLTFFALLDAAQKNFGDRFEFRLARINYLQELGSKDFPQQIERAAADSSRFSSQERYALCDALATLAMGQGDVASAARWWQEQAALRPNDLGSRYRLFEVAMQNNDVAAAQERLGEIQRIEGGNGPFGAYAAACCQILRARKGDRNGLADARRQLAASLSARPGWGTAELRLAEVAELESKWAEAADHYLRAIDHGQNASSVITRAVQLLYDRRRYADADRLLQKLKAQGPLSGEMARLAADVSFRNRDPERALKEGSAAHLADSKEWRDHVWMAQVLVAAGKATEAEAELRKAIDLGGTQPDPWVTLVQFYAANKQTAKADALLKEATSKLPRGQAALVLGNGYEVLGRRDQAEEQFKIALVAKPDDVATLRTLGEFYLLTGQASKAAPHLRRVLDPALKASDDVAIPVRRELVQALTIIGGYGNYCDALALLDQEVQKQGTSPDEQRLRAMLYSTRPGRHAEAIRLFEMASKGSTLSLEEKFTLARLYEEAGQWSKASENMAGALSSQGNEPQYIARYIVSLLRRGMTSEAEGWLTRLQQLRPDAFDTIALEARMAAARHQPDGAIAVLQKYASVKAIDAAEATARWGRAARLLDLLAQEDPKRASVYRKTAAEMYQKYAAESSDPDARLAYADFLIRQGQVQEGLSICTSTFGAASPEKIASVAMTAIQLGATQASALSVLEKWLTPVLDKAANPPLLMVLASIREQQARFADAQTVYRQAITKDPNNIVALNNLAYLLAHQPESAPEAVELVQRAIDRGGVDTALLDTRSVAYLSMGQTEPALKDVEIAVADNPSPVRYLHLGLARLAAKNEKGALDAFAKAKSSGLQANRLPPLDRQTYEKLQSTLEPK